MLKSFQFQSMNELGTDVVKLSFQYFETITFLMVWHVDTVIGCSTSLEIKKESGRKYY